MQFFLLNQVWPQRSFKVTNNDLFDQKITFSSVYVIDWLTNAAEHNERTKFDLYKDDICLILTLTYVLMDNFLSLFLDDPN